MNRRIKLAVVGGNRGGAFNSSIQILADSIELAAICDINEEQLKNWDSSFPGIKQ